MTNQKHFDFDMLSIVDRSILMVPVTTALASIGLRCLDDDRFYLQVEPTSEAAQDRLDDYLLTWQVSRSGVFFKFFTGDYQTLYREFCEAYRAAMAEGGVVVNDQAPYWARCCIEETHPRMPFDPNTAL